MTILFIALALLYNIFTSNGNPSFQSNPTVTNSMQSEDKCMAEFGTNAASIGSRQQFENAYDLCAQLRDDNGDTESCGAICCLGGNDIFTLNGNPSFQSNPTATNPMQSEQKRMEEFGTNAASIGVIVYAAIAQLADTLIFPRNSSYYSAYSVANDFSASSAMYSPYINETAHDLYDDKVSDIELQEMYLDLNQNKDEYYNVGYHDTDSSQTRNIDEGEGDPHILLHNFEMINNFVLFCVLVATFSLFSKHLSLNIVMLLLLVLVKGAKSTGTSTIICGDYQECKDATMFLPTNLIILCEGERSCFEATIDCPTSAKCTVSCTGDYSCFRATINWPTTDGLGHLICDGYGTCNGVTFPIPDPKTPLDIACDHRYECYLSTINCPTSAKCTVSCTGEYSCYRATINWPTTDGLGHLVCDGHRACDRVTFPIPDPKTPLNIACDNHYECYDATINCPTSAECTVSCTGAWSCYGATINWPTTDGLGHLVCDGYMACDGVTFPPAAAAHVSRQALVPLLKHNQYVDIESSPVYAVDSHNSATFWTLRVIEILCVIGLIIGVILVAIYARPRRVDIDCSDTEEAQSGEENNLL